MKNIILAIDSTSIVNTGGFTHLYHLIENFKKENHPEIKKILIYSSINVLDRLPVNDIIIRRSNFFLNRGKFFRLVFKLFIFDYFLKIDKVNFLLSLTGDYVGNFKPYVAISQNMLLYERQFWTEIKVLKEKIKLWINYRSQKKCFKSANGIIFISRYAQNYISKELNLKSKPNRIIHHGSSLIFFNYNFKKLKKKSLSNSFNFIYVSTIHVYKNQWNVIDAIWNLRQSGLDLTLTLIGPIIFAPSGRKLLKKIKEKDPDNQFITYIQEVPYEKLPNYYSKHDAIIYASTCENMPNILIESMASGLPIACSNKMPMPEFLGSGGYYFDANSIDSIISAIKELLNDKNPIIKIEQNIEFIKKLKWEETSIKTFNFIEDLTKTYV